MVKNWAMLFIEDLSSDDGWERVRALIVLWVLSRIWLDMPAAIWGASVTLLEWISGL